MPIYEYECDACGHRFETLQRMSDDPLKECPKCNESSLRKLISAASFKLKGQGWYESDFKNPQKTNKIGSGAGGSGDKGDKDGANKSSEAGSGSTSEGATPTKTEAGNLASKSAASGDAAK